MKRLSIIILTGLMHLLLSGAFAFTLNVEATPPGGGTLNTGGGSYEEGTKVSLRANPHTGFLFKGWYEGQEKLSDSRNYTYVMPARDASLKAVFDYDPAAPANPAMPDTATYYNFAAVVSPPGAGTPNITTGRYAAGASVGLRVSAHTGFVFRHWQDETGEVISDKSSFTYKMSAGDARLTAVYSYDPSAPADPEVLGTLYGLSVKSRPEGGGTFNTSSVKVAEGGNVRLYAYTNTGFRFVKWEDSKGNTVSEAREFNYVMPQGGETLYGVFEYDPEPPSNPAKNFWNKELGELIIDDFTPGNLSRAVTDAISGSGRDEVAMITVSGVMNGNDFGIANNYPSCTLLDLGRVTGITEIPSYAFDYTSLESVTLPATVEKIGGLAFAECGSLSSLTLFAMTPPVLESDVFKGVSEGLVVYVPSASISQYAESEGWKGFTILPITEDLRGLTVSLPEGCDPAPFAGMWLELTNLKNGQRMHYVVTDRASYTFANLMRNTSWKVELRNERGDVFGLIDEVEIKDDDVVAAFKDLSLPQTVAVRVLTPEGRDVTELASLTWTDAAGNYISQSATVARLPIGMELACGMVLPKDLSMVYQAPDVKSHVVKEGDNTLSCTLAAIPEVSLNGLVKDSATGLPLAGAFVTASQTFAGKYGATVSGKTDKTGAFSLKVADVPTSLTASATDYVSGTISCDTLMNGKESVTLPDLALKPVTGAVVSIGFTYRKSTAPGEDAPETQDWYGDTSNITYSIFNKTKQRPISNFSVQYPAIVLLEEVDAEDILEITASSLTSSFTPVASSAIVDESLRASAVFDLVEPGSIMATFSRNANPAVVASLYDSKGKLVKTYSYGGSSLKTGNLPEGAYTLVTMGESNFFNTIYDLVKLSETGLEAGTDYTSSVVEVKDGVISLVEIDEVPTFDESKLYYTGSATSFSVNKPSIVAGNYLTLTGRVDFKGAYSSEVSNVSLLVDLPESCSFVENSVMVGNSTSSYTLEGNRLTVPLARYTDRVRFCVIPTLGGDYAPSAFVRFDLDGKTVTQPIGSARYTAQNLSLSVPGVVAKTTVPVSGTAVGKSTVEIYDGDMLIGQTQSLANGTWSTTCELVDPYNLSTHQIYAKVTSKDSIELRSETVECTYDMNAIRVSKVTMYHWNPEMQKTFESVFDFMNPKSSATKWTVYYPDKKFTYTIDFTDNSPEKVSDVVLYVHTADGRKVPVEAEYDETKDIWTAAIDMGRSSDGYYPVNCSVDFTAESEKLVDTKELKDACNDYLDIAGEYASTIDKFDHQVSDDNDEWIDDLDSTEPSDWSAALDSIIDDLVGVGAESDEENTSYSYFAGLTDSELDNLIQESEEIEYEKELTALQVEMQNILKVMSDEYEGKIILEDGTSIERKTCDGLSKESLIEKGFKEFLSTGGKNIYYFSTETGSELVDFDNDVYSIIMYGSVANTKSRFTRSQGNEGLDKFNEIIAEINSYYQPIASAWEKTNESLLDFANKFKEDYVKASFDFGRKKSNYNKKLAKLNRLKTELKSLNSLSLDYQIKLGEIKNYQTEVRQAKRLMNSAGRLKTLTGIAHSSSKQLPGIFKKRLPLVKYADAIYTFVSIAREFQVLYLSVPNPCKDDQANADALRQLCIGLALEVEGVAGIKLGVTALLDLATFSGIAAMFGTGGTSVLVSAATAITNILINIGIDKAFDNWKDDEKKKFRKARNKLECIKKCGTDGYPPCPDDGGDGGGSGNPGDGSGNDGGNGNGGANDSNCPNDDVAIDPSGFVYEGVMSNRVEGVTATIYYKEMVEDMYGDLHENVVKWDAAEYAQENPLFTDENGDYRWDVPQGLWQVKFEKEGYETTYSDWLPVPPPQLDVNIAIKQNVQPNIKSARAFEDAVEFEFDKYMQPALLNADNVVVLSGETPIEGTVKLLNEEKSSEGSDETFASKVRFIADAPFSASEVTLLVKNRVKSYADVRMQEDFMQSFKVELEVRKIECDSVVDVAYGGSRIVKVMVLPAAASAGKTLNVRTTSSMVASTDVESVVIAGDGSAEIPVNGELPGTSALILSVDGYDIASTTVINVKKGFMKTEAPKANIASGSTVDKGTEITLSCGTEGATIVYTLDGSCPCDDTEARTVYDGTPIVVNGNVTIKAIAYAPDMYESDIVEFTYYVDGSGVGEITSDADVRMYPLPMRETLNVTVGTGIIKKVAFTNIAGATMVAPVEPASTVSVDVSTFAAGIYIVAVETEGGEIVRKVMKVK